MIELGLHVVVMANAKEESLTLPVLGTVLIHAGVELALGCRALAAAASDSG